MTDTRKTFETRIPAAGPADDANGQDFLTGQCLVAMPNLGDPRFERSVIYICTHSADGAMGFVVNKAIEDISFPDLLEQLNIEDGSRGDDIAVHFGGPVETSRGFVLHSADYFNKQSTQQISSRIHLTATLDVLKALSQGRGPRQALLALGYAGWGPGQLEDEIQQNGWLHVPADETLLFGPDDEAKWSFAMTKLGIDLSLLSGTAGHA
jgi:putative transcriptional regulator